MAVNNRINIVEFPTNLGLKEPQPGVEPGVKNLPAWLRGNGFYHMLKPKNIYTLEPPPYSMQMDPEAGVRNSEAVIRYAKQQAELMDKVLQEAPFPVIIGGDCSILIGNAIALKKRGNYGLFFLDGHTDFMLPELSQTGGIAGMDLAVVTGYGHPKLTDIYGLKPYFEEENIWCVGNREYDRDYVAPILNSKIHYYDLDSLHDTGTEQCTNDFLNMVTDKKLDGFFIHLDVDVLDDHIMPAVDSRTPDGLTYAELNHILEKLLPHEKACGMEITILDPDRDPTAEYTREFMANMQRNILNSRKK
ncbi:arginase family protein [Sinomicrobium weinanense]|uniref:Arginase family protein n=1 Tax=Sinomicrobium weinanense TaxID=2842200 RepID=A0A926JS23_9FLAO|nr:arginase family protein [Sinomicrobium weinanense]MBC9796176.1 arginase family protein [Sinomicrobium weinanense]MBU3123455.1 arginase family protein [Sinomicrobium weinanense]